jgi:hypothetical protein
MKYGLNGINIIIFTQQMGQLGGKRIEFHFWGLFHYYKKFEYDLNHGWKRMLYHQHIMKKYKVLLLSLQLGFLVATDICNSWYLYNLECY